MKTKPPHTPGPWRLLSPLNGHMICDRAQLVVAVCTNGNEESNANLIAAAPELLAALNETLDTYVALANSGDAGNWNPEDELHVVNARAAIAKATGEQP